MFEVAHNSAQALTSKTTRQPGRSMNLSSHSSPLIRGACFSPILVAVCLVAMPMGASSQAEFWYEDFTDGNLTDSEVEWVFDRDHDISPDGLQLSTPSTSPTSAGPNWPTEREGWSIRTQARLLQDHGFFGAGTGPLPGAGPGDATWNIIRADGIVALGSLGSGRDQRSDFIETDLRPLQEDVIVQLDTLDGVMRMWAWRKGEQPEEDIAPLIEEAFHLPLASPGIWARSTDGPSSALFSWAAFSTEHMPVNMVLPAANVAGDVNKDGKVDFADFLILSANFGTEVDPPGTKGDFNGNGYVQFTDFLVLSANFGQSASAVASVPEPTGLVLVLFGVGILGLARRRRD